MVGPSRPFLAAALWLTASLPLSVTAARADPEFGQVIEANPNLQKTSSTAAPPCPSYTSEAIVQVFAEGREAKKRDKTRNVCFQGDPDPGCEKNSAAPAAYAMLATFEFNSDRLTPAARDNLTEFAKALLDPKLKGSIFEVDGHTDARGSARYNVDLSERRAKAVVNYLISLGVAPETLTAHGWGEARPRVADAFSPENRRVEVHLAE